MQATNKQKTFLLGKLILVLITFLIVNMLLGNIVELIPRKSIANSPPLFYTVCAIIRVAFGLGILALFVKLIDKEKIISSSWLSLKGQIKNFLFGGLFAGICIVIVFFAIVKTNWSQVEVLPFEIKLLLYASIHQLCTAFIEEFIFRGYLLRKLLEKFTPLVSLVLSSLPFALLHLLLGDITFLDCALIFLISILLGLLYLKTKNIWLPVGFHWFWNYTKSILGMTPEIGQQSILKLNFENMDNTISYACCIILPLAILYFYKKQTAKSIK